MENSNKLQQFLGELDQPAARTQAEGIVSDANGQKDKIIAAAKTQAEQIVAQAKDEAARLKASAEHELRLSAAQLRSAIRQQIERMVLVQTAGAKVSQVWKDGSFIKELILKAVERFGGDKTEGMSVVLPADVEEEFVEQVRAAVVEKFGAGVEVVTDARVKVPLRIMAKEGGYYVSFTDADFQALFTAYLRPKVAQMLFGNTDK